IAMWTTIRNLAKDNRVLIPCYPIIPAIKPNTAIDASDIIRSVTLYITLAHSSIASLIVLSLSESINIQTQNSRAKNITSCILSSTNDSYTLVGIMLSIVSISVIESTSSSSVSGKVIFASTPGFNTALNTMPTIIAMAVNMTKNPIDLTPILC